jgi:hypothetical protein
MRDGMSENCCQTIGAICVVGLNQFAAGERM